MEYHVNEEVRLKSWDEMLQEGHTVRPDGTIAIGDWFYDEDWIDEGEYKIYLFWFEALKLKIRTDWIEPAHYERVTSFKYSDLIESGKIRERKPVKPDVTEPVHWFDPSIQTSINEVILISVIDEIYPELRLVDKISSFRRTRRHLVRHEVKEPVHSRRIEYGPGLDKVGELLSELSSVLRQYGF